MSPALYCIFDAKASWPFKLFRLSRGRIRRSTFDGKGERHKRTLARGLGHRNFLDLVICRHLEQCFIGRTLLNIVEGRGYLAKTRIIL